MRLALVCGFTSVLVHAAPAQMGVVVRTDDGDLVAESDVDRDDDYSPMTLLQLEGSSLRRSEIWPTDGHLGMLVLVAGGEAGILQRWETRRRPQLVALVDRVQQPPGPASGLGAGGTADPALEAVTARDNAG